MSAILQKVIQPLLDKITPSCEIITQKISRSMDEPLTWKERIQVRLHLMACVLCTRYREQLLAMRKMIQNGIGELEEEQLSPESGLSTDAKDRMKEQLSNKSGES